MARWLPPLTREGKGSRRRVEAEEGSVRSRERVVEVRGGQPAGKPAGKPVKVVVVVVVMMVVVVVGSPPQPANPPAKRWW